MNTPSKVPTLARLAFRIPPERRAEFEAVYSRRLLPILKAHGLIESSDPGRPTPDDVFARLFEVGAVSDVSEKQEALRKDPAWREVLSVLERDSRPAQPGGAFRTNLSLYAAPAGPGRRIPLLLPKAEPAGRGKGHWRSYDATDGLEGDTVWTMFQDRRGDLWFGGGGGVVRWDGQRFTRFRAADGLTFFPRVLAILEDRRGDLWFGGGGGAVRWDGETSTHFTATEGMPLPVVATIHEDGRGDLWFGGSGGAVRWDGRTFTTFSGGDGPSLARILAIHEDRRGDIWFAGDGGAVRWDGQTFTPITAKNGPGSNQVRGICMDRDGVLWFSTSGGVRRYDGKIWDAVTTRDGLINNDVYSVFQDRDGAFWFGTHGGVSRYDGKEWTAFTVADGLATNLVRPILQDADGALWFGTSGGVSRYDGSGLVAYTPEEGVPDSVYAILQGRDGELWLSSQGGGVCRCDWKGDASDCEGDAMSRWGTVTSLTAADGLPDNVVQPILQDRDGNFWFGTIEGACRYDGQTLTVYTTADGLANNHIQGIFQDREGLLWFGTFAGLSRYDGESFVTFTMADGLAGNYVWTIFQDREGVLWFGGTGGVSRYEGEGRTFRALTTDDGSITDMTVSILQDRNGALWFGSHDGVKRYDEQGFTAFTPENGLAGTFVRSILQDREGHFWFGTTGGGVSRFDGRVFQTLTREDGLTGNVVYALSQDPDGGIWIGASGGLTRYRPSPASPPQVFVDAVVADRRYEHPEDLEIPAFARLTTFEFHGKSLKTRPDAMVYRYRLKGFEEEWKNTRERRVEYQDLPVGDYTFEVVAVDRDLVYSEVPARVRLVIVRDARDEQIDELERRVRVRTQELEEANRELTVEAALARVRATALEMKTSADLVKTGAKVFEEFEGLAFPIKRGGFVIANERSQPPILEAWGITAKGTSMHGFPVPVTHPAMQELYAAWKRQEDTFHLRLAGDELRDFIRFLEDLGYPMEWSDLEYHYTQASFTYGTLFASTSVRLSDENLDVLRKFRDGFSFAYTRFLELQAAEQRATEARIETALERVRVAALAMKTSKDLAQTGTIVFQQLKDLGVPAWRGGFAVVQETSDRPVFEFWGLTGEGVIIRGVEVPADTHGLFERLYAAWKRDDDNYDEGITGDALREFIQALQKTGYPAELPAGWTTYHASAILFAQGCLYAITQDGLSDEDVAVLRRFRDVFSFAYTRYLDLEKAEAQAKAAARQAAVDRVRAEIATMRTAADLERVTPLIWTELTGLGVPFFRCGVFIVDEDDRRTRVYLTNPRGASLAALDLSFDSHPFNGRLVEAWRKKDVHVERWDAKFMLEWVAFLQGQGQVTQPERYLDGEAPPESLVIQCVPFVHGMLYLGSADPLVKEDIGLMKSLAGAFSVAYARYLDFQKLEAQNRALEEANRKVQEATERKSLFLASMSHELRTPMNAIIGFTRLVLRRAGDLLPERQRENLEKVQQSAGHLLGLINDILDLSKIEAGRMEVQAETFGVKEMVAGCCATVGPLVKEGVVLGYEVAEGVGEAHTDPAKLRQVVINLLSNALKFTEAGEVSVRVTRAEEVLVLAVSDTGAGIPPEMLEAIFEEFRQVEGANREHKGTGLGLSITKKLVELLGGTVSVESEAWKGSIFTVKVPAVYRG